MTLIAAYRENETPILLGDVLITNRFNDEFHCKKIVKISPNFVIGWTGMKSYAMSVLKELFFKFKNKIVTMKEIERFLLEFDTSKFLDDENLTMLGWVIEEKQYCFEWFSEVNKYDYKEIYYLESEKGFFAGSGSDFFEKLLKESKNFYYEFSASNQQIQALGKVLQEVCSLTNAEYLATDKSWRERFGFGYEVLIFNGKEFNYLDNILYFTLDAFTTEDWELLKYEVLPYLYRYKTFGNISLFQIQKNTKDRADIHQHYVGKGYEKDVQSFLELQNAIRGKQLLLSNKAAYYCLSIRIINGKKVMPCFLGIFGNDNNLFNLNQKGNLTMFEFSPIFHSILQKTIEANKY